MGVTGAVGQRFVSLLFGHPWFRLEVLAASGKSAGNRYKDSVNWILEQKMPKEVEKKKVEKIQSKVFKNEDVKLIFSALPFNVAKDIESKLAKEGFCLFSNAGAHRMKKDVPLLIADVNPKHLVLVKVQRKSRSGYIVTNPNCTVTGLATALKPLDDHFSVKNVVVSTYQALSGAGYPGVASLDIVGNVLPHIRGEEEKVEEECKKILGKLSNQRLKQSGLSVIASCARVPVRDGHLESVLVELKKEPDITDVKRALNDFKVNLAKKLPTAPKKPIIVTEDEDRPQPRLDLYNGSPERARGMAVTVGRLKKRGNKIRFFLLVHNTIRGAAGCSIMNAELALDEGYL